MRLFVGALLMTAFVVAVAVGTVAELRKSESRTAVAASWSALAALALLVAVPLFASIVGWWMP